ncbi:hypothetical protein CP533_6294, partial [Ophiocordyceps camponoti-saundersi (nom. inval.)]
RLHLRLHASRSRERLPKRKTSTSLPSSAKGPSTPSTATTMPTISSISGEKRRRNSLSGTTAESEQALRRPNIAKAPAKTAAP